MKNILSFLVLGLLPGWLIAQPSENWTEVNLSITDGQVIPRYTAFESSSAGLAAAAQALCQATNAMNLENARKSFHASMDAWQQIQHVQFGPITYFNWNFRLHYWPDEKGTGPRQLDELIAAGNEEVLQSENFSRESVAVQGFPALERLLFDDESLAAFREDKYRCQVAQTIALNINEIASGVRQRWVDEFRATIANADERGFFESAEDATIDFLKAQVESVRRIQQQKLEEVIAESAARTRIRRAESWRSERSIKNIKLNVIALQNLFNDSASQLIGLSEVFQAEDVTIINQAFAQLLSSLTPLPASYEAVLIEEQGHEQLRQIAAQLDALFEAFEAGLKNTDLYLGFNSLDGD
jgi:predicted lipoprotein